MSRPFKLYRLQQIDTQLDWINTRLLEIAALLSGDERVQAATQAAAQTEQQLLQAQKALRQTEDDVRQQRIKIEQSESTLYGGKIQNPKELKDLEKEVASLKRYLGVLEDRQLEAMLVEEDASAQHCVNEEILAQARQAFEAQSQDLIREREKILKDHARLDEERKAATESTPVEDLNQYAQLRKARRGVAVAKVVDRACSACGSTLNAALLNAAHSPNELNRCESCSRILYLG